MWVSTMRRAVVLLVVLAVAVSTGSTPAAQSDVDRTSISSGDDGFHVSCEERFLEAFAVCDREHNNLHVDDAERQHHAALFARCVVQLTTEFVECTDRDFVMLEAMIAGIKQRARSDPIPESLVHFKSTPVSETAPEDLKAVVRDVNRKKRERAEATVRQRMVRKAEANTLAILMAYKKVITRVRSEDVLSSIRDDSKSSQQFDNVYEKIGLRQPASPTASASMEDSCPIPPSTHHALFTRRPVVAAGAAVAGVVVVFASAIVGRWSAHKHAAQRRDEAIKRYRSEQQHHAREMQRMQRLVDDANSAAASARDVARKQEKRAVDMQNQNEQLQKEAKQHTTEMETLQAALEQRDSTIKKHHNTIARLQKELASLKETVAQQEKKLLEETEISRRLTKQNESLSAQLLLMQRDTSVAALKRRIEHLRHAMQQTQDLLVIAQVKEKIRQASARLHVVSPVLQQLCRSCMERPISVAVDPCGHACLCRVCSTDAQSCPVCNQAVQRQILLVFEGAGR